MKKGLFILALAALMMPAFVSCSKDDKDDSKKKTTPTFEAPKYQEEAMKLTLVQNPNPGTEEQGEIKSIEFMESGIYLIERLVKKVKADDNYETVYITGTYTVSGSTYSLEGFGTVKVEGSGESVSVTITEVDESGAAVGEPVTVTASAETAAETSDVYRTWTVDELYIKVTGGNLKDSGVSKTFKGCDLKEISDYLKKNDVKFDDSDLEKYNVKNITISGTGTFLIQFQAAEPFVGVSDVQSGKFAYDFEAGQGGNKIINAKGDGKIEFYVNNAREDRCALTLNGEIKGNSTTYTSKIEFRLKELK